MKYWDGLWMKEGFATLLAWYASDKLFPWWHTWNDFVSDALQAALKLDSLANSHPVELVIKDTTKAKQMFDHISYKKGCCILKVLLDDMGEEGFFNGLKLYIGRHKFGNTESEDLWRAFQDCGDPKVSGRMHVWSKEAGFLVVIIAEEYDNADADSGEATALCLHQKRFVMMTGRSRNLEGPLYPLRISVRSETGIDMYDMEEQEIIIPARGKAFLKINADHGGFFRTSYSPGHLQKL